MISTLKMLVQSLVHVPFVVCHMPHVEALELIIYSVVNLCCGIKGLLLIHVFQSKNSCRALIRTYILQQATCAIVFLGFWL